MNKIYFFFTLIFLSYFQITAQQLTQKFLSRDEADQHALILAVQENTKAINKQIAIQGRDIVLLQSNGSNLSSAVNDGVLILSSAPCPAGHIIKVTDWNLNFTVTAGAVRVVVLDANDTIVNNILLLVNSSINGNGGAVLQNGQKLAVVGSTSGAGTFGCFFSAELKKVGGF